MTALVSSSIVLPATAGGLTVTVASTAEDFAFCRAALEDEHALGAGHPAGCRLWQMVREGGAGGAPVAVLVWAASALHLQDRDAWIGWDAMTRSRRLGLIVNNSRLLILEKSRRPNLATQALGAALRALPAQWEGAHGYAPLLAEAFTDLETHHGTSYKASNWMALGMSKGCGRHRAEFYVRHGRPKKLWVYPLHRTARALLCAERLPAAHAAGEIAPVVRCPLRHAQLRSLEEVFAELDDPRRINSRRYRLRTMLMLVCVGLLCGARSLADIMRAVQLLGPRERRALELPFRKGSEARRVPCYNAFRDLLPRIDLEQLLRLLTGWLTQHGGTLPRTLALDGKDLGGQLGQIVSLINTTACGGTQGESGPPAGSPAPPVAMALCAGKGHEQAAAAALLAREDVDLRGAILTADALHCQHATLHEVVAHKGGDYVIALKDNQPRAAAHARTQLAGELPLFAPMKKATAG